MITVDRLTKTYPGDQSPALRGVSLRIAPGTMLGVLGDKGAGKSTLIRCLELAVRADAGALVVDGTDLLAPGGAHLSTIRRHVTAVPDVDTLSRQRTVAGNVALPLERAGLDGPARRSRVTALLDLVSLSDRAGDAPDALTDGQRRRLAIAQALAFGPSLLLADEPTGGLNAAEAAAVLTVLDRARTELELSVLLCTSQPTVLRKGCDEVALLEDGEIVEHGSLLELAITPGSRTAAAVLPHVDPTVLTLGGHDRLAEVLLVGFAAVGALLPEAASRFDVDIEVIGGGMTRFGDTPVARFGVGVRGAEAEAALRWIGEAGADVQRVPTGPHCVAA